MSGMIPDRNGEYVMGKWKNDNFCHKVAKTLSEFCSCSSVVWKVELASYETGYLA